MDNYILWLEVGITFKKAVPIIIIILLSISLTGCSNQGKGNNKKTDQTSTSSNNQETSGNQQSSQSKNTTENKDKLTIEDIKAKYTGGENGKIVNVTEYGGHYVLVEYINSADLNCFDFYNLKTGDKDTLPVYPCNVKLQEIKNENDIKFITDGVVTLNGHKYFPQILECYRGQEVTGVDGDFYQIWHDYYLPVDQGFNMGVKDNETIADIKVSLAGLEVLFEPMKGLETEFDAAYTTVQPTKTSYDKAKNQFIIDFEKTDTDSKINLSKISEENRYVKSVSIKKNGSNTVITISLKDTAKYYTIGFSHLEPDVDDFPSLDFKFSNEFKIQ